MNSNNKLLQNILNIDLKKQQKDLNRKREIEYNLNYEDYNQEKFIKLDLERKIKSRKELYEDKKKFSNSDFVKDYKNFLNENNNF